jgi:hypothetical protein
MGVGFLNWERGEDGEHRGSASTPFGFAQLAPSEVEGGKSLGVRIHKEQRGRGAEEKDVHVFLFVRNPG